MTKLRAMAIKIAADPKSAKSAFRIASFVQTPGRGKLRKKREKPVAIQRVVSLKLQIREEIVKEAQAPPPLWLSCVANDHAAARNGRAA